MARYTVALFVLAAVAFVAVIAADAPSSEIEAKSDLKTSNTYGLGYAAPYGGFYGGYPGFGAYPYSGGYGQGFGHGYGYGYGRGFGYGGYPSPLGGGGFYGGYPGLYHG